MADFSNIAALNVDETTLAPYTFYYIPDEPVIWLAPATEENKPYINAHRRAAAEQAAKEIRRPSGEIMTPEEREENRDIDRKIIAEHCAKRWDRIKDRHGNIIEFSQEECLAFLRALPNWMFDPIRGFVLNQANFIQKPTLAPGTAETLGND